MSNKKKHNRPKYGLEFKQDATKLVLEKGYSQQQAAEHLGKAHWDAGYERNASFRRTNRRPKSL